MSCVYRAWLAFVVAALVLGGCAATATVAAIPGALVEGAVNFFRSQEESLPVNMRISLASVQQGLRRMELDVDVLEPVEEGYAIEFGNDKLDGTIELKRQTPMLTTISIIVHRGVGRQNSVEQAIINMVRDVSERINTQKKFDFAGYHNIRSQPSIKTQRVGWYRPGALLEASKSRKDGWLRIKMPSGKRGYLKGKLSEKHG
ncbi:MAG: SH3 domain-containing protein [Mariprofundaceae bacterium]|nr:SH3 domain-containing protein [Mariprofundaceae bacterium]